MIDFLLCVVQYLLIAIAIAVIGGIGIFIGITLRKRSDAKKAKNTEE
jgi:hypothetical protein